MKVCKIILWRERYHTWNKGPRRGQNLIFSTSFFFHFLMKNLNLMVLFSFQVFSTFFLMHLPGVNFIVLFSFQVFSTSFLMHLPNVNIILVLNFSENPQRNQSCFKWSTRFSCSVLNFSINPPSIVSVAIYPRHMNTCQHLIGKLLGLHPPKL